MTGNEAYRGSGAPGDSPFGAKSDRRIVELAEQYLAHDPMGKAAYRAAADPLRTVQMQYHRLLHQTPPLIGTILHAMPGLGWYKVQTGVSNGWMPCCAMHQGSTNPIGPRSAIVYRPNSRVLIFKPLGVVYGIILGAVPDPLADGTGVQLPDWLWQGSNVGYKRSKAHKFPIKGLAQQGNVLDFSNTMPVDGAGEEWTHVTETGHALLMDPFQAMLRLNEMCGIFLNHFDSYTRLAGLNYDFFSSAASEMLRLDEGENRIHIQRFVYPWETIGVSDPGIDIATELDDHAVQYTEPRGKVDLPKGSEDTQPFARAGEHHGYPGQGGQRYVQVLASPPDVQHYADETAPEGLFTESIGLNGSVLLGSAKEIGIVKSVKFLMPKEIKPPEHGKGDDAREGNYKFSGMFGDADNHNVGDIDTAGSLRSFRRAAGVMDIISYYRDWQRLHVFHYHQGDYSVPTPSDSHFNRVQDNMDFDVLSSQNVAPDPTPQMLKIDHRYEDVEYYQRESFLFFHDDGGISMGCGFGSDLLFNAQGVTVRTPADFLVVPARSFLVKAGAQAVINAHGSVDLTSSTKDARVRAYKNLHMLGEQSVLIENKSKDRLQNYAGLIGEDVHPSGIVCKTTTDLVMLCSDMFVRADIADSLAGGKGQIVMDSGQDKGSFIVNGVKAEFFVRNGVYMWLSSQVDGTPSSSYYFGRNRATFSVDVAISGNLELCCDDVDGGDCSGNIYVCGNIVALNDIMAGGTVSSDDTDSPLPRNDPTAISTATATINDECELVVKITQKGPPEANKWRGPYHSRTTDVAWSYRDPPTDVQYKTENLKFLESRWQQIVRLGGGTGGTVWNDEPPVLYQGRQTYPWPGQNCWINREVFVYQGEDSMYDRAKGNDKDRPDPYTTRSLPALETAVMGNVFTYIM